MNFRSNVVVFPKCAWVTKYVFLGCISFYIFIDMLWYLNEQEINSAFTSYTASICFQSQSRQLFGKATTYSFLPPIYSQYLEVELS